MSDPITTAEEMREAAARVAFGYRRGMPAGLIVKALSAIVGKHPRIMNQCATSRVDSLLAIFRRNTARTGRESVNRRK